MLVLPFICLLFTLVKGDTSLCSMPVDTVCKEPHPNVEKDIPGNARELRAICSSTIDYVECLHNYDVACEGRSWNSALYPPLYYHRIKSYLDEACDETSPFNDILSRELPCIKRRISGKDIICATSNRDILRAYDKYTSKHPVRGVQKKSLRLRCLENVATAACLLDDIEEECGFFAYDAAADALTSSQILAYRCDLDVFQELQGIVQYLEINGNMKESLKKRFVVEIE